MLGPFNRAIAKEIKGMAKYIHVYGKDQILDMQEQRSDRKTSKSRNRSNQSHALS
jgi:hypothetical protein